MLTIRLRRTGKKKQPNYRIVVADNRAPIYGKYIEMVGHFNPRTKEIVLKKEEAIDWMNKGAKPTNTVGKIFKKENIKHKSIVIKKFRAISKKELEKQKEKEETEKAKIQAEKEKAKAAFEQQVEAEKATQPTSEEKLQESADESIKKEKESEKETNKEEQNVEPKEDKKSETQTEPEDTAEKSAKK